MDKLTLQECIGKIKQVALAMDVVIDGKLISFSRFKRLADPHKFTDGRYKVYLGRPGWSTIGVIEHLSGLSRKDSALAEFYTDLKALVENDDNESVKLEYMHWRQKYSIGWK